MSHLADEREALESKEKEMRDMVEKAETKRSWFNAFTEWVETVATFLDEKVNSTFTFMTMAKQCQHSILFLKNLKRNTYHC